MLLYLDNCCFNRPFDDQAQLRISLETQAKLFVQQEILSGRFELLWSYILEYENSKNPFDTRLSSVQGWKEVATTSVVESDELLDFAEKVMDVGAKKYDALHLACAHIGKCDYFLTVDKNLLKISIPEIKLCNPIDFVRELEG